MNDKEKQEESNDMLYHAMHAYDVMWVVNDMGELGVRVNGRYFFLYLGGSIEYFDALHDDGTPIMVRIVGQCEFGKTCQPRRRPRPPYLRRKGEEKKAKYFEPLFYTPGLSLGRHEDSQWRQLPPSPQYNRKATTLEGTESEGKNVSD
jgi:hypothetical protein